MAKILENCPQAPLAQLAAFPRSGGAGPFDYPMEMNEGVP